MPEERELNGGFMALWSCGSGALNCRVLQGGDRALAESSTTLSGTADPVARPVTEDRGDAPYARADRGARPSFMPLSLRDSALTQRCTSSEWTSSDRMICSASLDMRSGR